MKTLALLFYEALWTGLDNNTLYIKLWNLRLYMLASDQVKIYSNVPVLNYCKFKFYIHKQ